jgi:hypothetical protein
MMMIKFIFGLAAIIFSLNVFAQQNISLSQQEKDAILYMREEEKLARDVYDFLYTKWGGNPFGNIRNSEQNHMDRMKSLISTYKLADPVEKNNDKPGIFANSLLQKYYNELVVAGSLSFTEALKVGAKIEELDITDLDERMQQTQQQDIRNTYSYLRMASGNHLRAFVRRLSMQGVMYEPVILNKSEFERIVAAESDHGRFKFPL